MTGYLGRALYYRAQAYAGQLGKGQNYEPICPVVGVNIVDFIIFPGSQPVHMNSEGDPIRALWGNSPW